MPDCTRRGFIAATPVLACFAIYPINATAQRPDQLLADIETRAAELLQALNLTGGAEWTMKAGADGDVLLFHRKT